MSIIVHIAEKAIWEAALNTGVYQPASLQTEGFIHLSAPAQVIRVANTFYAGFQDLVLLVVDPAVLTAELRYEAPVHEDSVELFPHLYGPLNLEAVIDVLPFPSRTDGSFGFPPELTN